MKYVFAVGEKSLVLTDLERLKGKKLVLKRLVLVLMNLNYKAKWREREEEEGQGEYGSKTRATGRKMTL